MSIEVSCEDSFVPMACKIDWFFVNIVPWWPLLLVVIPISIVIWIVVSTWRNIDRDRAETAKWITRHNEPGDDL